jgi:hypothetical protein
MGRKRARIARDERSQAWALRMVVARSEAVLRVRVGDFSGTKAALQQCRWAARQS